MPLIASRIYYRTAKFANKNGVMIPYLEFTDGSGVYIKAVPCKIDNTGETSPAIDIVIADTLYGQQSGTGSNDSTTGYILNDGEYMTFSTATAYAKMTYKVGGGTTSFANITKNRIYISSNGSANSATKDPSHQMGVNLWYRVQSVVRVVSDLTDKVNEIARDVLNYSPWQTWTPVVTWTTATPASVVYFARYCIIGKTLFFKFAASSTDSNAATGMKFTLPVKIPSDITYPQFAASEFNGTTFYNIIAGWSESNQAVTCYNFTTIPDGTPIYVRVTGSCEIE